MQAGPWATPPSSLQRQVFGPYSGGAWAFDTAGLAAPLSGRSGSGPPSQAHSRAASVPRHGSRPASRPPAGRSGAAGYDGGLDGAHREVIDLSSCGGFGDDLQRAKDEKLLEMLGEMARGASDDEDVTSNVLEMLPIEVQEDDPTLRAMLLECGVVWEEVQAEANAKQELQSRLTGELRQIQDRSSRQHQESSALTNRLMTAKQTLGDKLKEASAVHQDLRVRITDEWRGNERLRLSLSDGVRNIATLAENLNKEILEVGASQRRLVEELQQASATQAQLQSELQSERVNTWRQSTDVVMAIARGTKPTTAVVEPASAPGFNDINGPHAAGLSLPVSSRTLHDAGRSDDDLTSQLVTERSTLLRTKAASAEEQAELEQRCRSQALRISELNKEVALEESSRSQLEFQLEDFAARVRACGVELSTSLQGEQEFALPNKYEGAPKDAFDVLSQLHNVTELCEELQDCEAECRRAAEEHQEAQEILEAEKEGLDLLRTNLLMNESVCEDNAQRFVDGSAAVELLRGEVQSEQASHRGAEQATNSQRHKLRSQVQQQREQLVQICDLNERLAMELETREATGCFRRRGAPSGAVRQEAVGQKGGQRKGGPPPLSSSPGARSPNGRPYPGKGKGKSAPGVRPGGGPKGGKGGPPGRPYEDGNRPPLRSSNARGLDDGAGAGGLGPEEEV